MWGMCIRGDWSENGTLVGNEKKREQGLIRLKSGTKKGPRAQKESASFDALTGGREKSKTENCGIKRIHFLADNKGGIRKTATVRFPGFCLDQFLRSTNPIRRSAKMLLSAFVSLTSLPIFQSRKIRERRTAARNANRPQNWQRENWRGRIRAIPGMPWWAKRSRSDNETESAFLLPNWLSTIKTYKDATPRAIHYTPFYYHGTY